jgi:hypothetical protein
MCVRRLLELEAENSKLSAWSSGARCRQTLKAFCRLSLLFTASPHNTGDWFLRFQVNFVFPK